MNCKNKVSQCILQFGSFSALIEKNDTLLDEFDEEVWNTTIENVVIYQDRKIVFIFKDGLELEKF